jgi:hypothetical protein
MALADWLLPLLLLASDEHGVEPFDWARLDPSPLPVAETRRPTPSDLV